MKKIILLIVVSILICSGQDEYPKFKKVIPGPEYEAGIIHRFFFGDHWRDVWTIPIKVPVLDLNSFADGLQPYEVGGGMQTRSLKFYGQDGQRWKFRSIDKDPSALLPKDLRNTFAERLLKDQISSANPFGSIVAAELLDALGIIQAKPIIVVLPDDPKLGKFRDEFAGMLGTIEVHPDEAENEEDAAFYDTEKIKGTYKLFETVEDNRFNKVKADDFLKARLLDVLIGDWDRHADQWRWVKVEAGKWDFWKPVPRDRDQAFAKFDGLVPAFAAYLIPQLNSFDEDYPQLEDLTWNGRHIDRRFLTELPCTKWDSVVAFVKEKITDDVIYNAVKKLPDEQFKIAGDELIEKLKSRRDKLDEAAHEFYEVVNNVADIYGTNKDDYVLVERIDNESTSVTIYNLLQDDLTPKGEPYFHKVFENDITSEIRIYMLDDDDYVLVKGEVDESPLVRVIGGSGKDIFADNSIVHGNFLTITPIPDAENATRFYDHGDGSIFIESAGTLIDKEKVEDVEDLVLKYEPTQQNRGERWLLLPALGYNSNDGLLAGATINLHSYNFRKIPYEYFQQVRFLYASLPNSYSIEYFGEFIEVFDNTDFVLDIVKSELKFINYFGFGNENKYDQNLFNNDFYRLQQELVFINPKLRFILSDDLDISLGLFYEFNKSSLNNSELINGFRYGQYGFGELQNMGLNSNIKIDTRDNDLFPFTGSFLRLSSRYYHKILNSEDEYFSGNYDLRQYLTFEFPLRSTLALRSSGGKTWGKYPFYHAQFIGGEDNLRAYTRERFSGDAAVTFQAELRTLLTETKIIVKGEFGVNLFAETGRVFTANQSSDKWHPSFGGGLWASYLDRRFLISINYASSKDEQKIYLGTKMAF